MDRKRRTNNGQGEDKQQWTGRGEEIIDREGISNNGQGGDKQ